MTGEDANGALAATNSATRDNSTDTRSSAVQQASGWVLVSAGVGFVVGLMWLLLAPRVTLTVTEGGTENARSAATAPFSADLVLGGLLLIAGVVLTFVWLARSPTRAGLTGLVLGGLLAGALAAWVGSTFSGSSVDPESLPVGTTIELGLDLRSWPVLLWWPAAALVLAALFAPGRFSSPTSEPEAVQWQAESPTPE